MSSAGRADASAFVLAAASARMSMSEDDSVILAATGAGACLESAASEKSTLLSLRSPVSGAATVTLARLVALGSARLSAPAVAAPAKRSVSLARRFSL